MGCLSEGDAGLDRAKLPELSGGCSVVVHLLTTSYPLFSAVFSAVPCHSLPLPTTELNLMSMMEEHLIKSIN